MRGVIICNEKLCSGCGRCLLRCSLKKEAVYNLKKARLHLINSIEDMTRTVVACGICSRELCVEVCPKNALKLNNGILTVLEENCSGCGLCVKACYFNAIRLHPQKKVPLACDLCGGDPECVKACPSGALYLTSKSDLKPGKVVSIQKLAVTGRGVF